VKHHGIVDAFSITEQTSERTCSTFWTRHLLDTPIRLNTSQTDDLSTCRSKARTAITDTRTIHSFLL